MAVTASSINTKSISTIRKVIEVEGTYSISQPITNDVCILWTPDADSEVLTLPVGDNREGVEISIVNTTAYEVTVEDGTSTVIDISGDGNCKLIYSNELWRSVGGNNFEGDVNITGDVEISGALTIGGGISGTLTLSGLIMTGNIYLDDNLHIYFDKDNTAYADMVFDGSYLKYQGTKPFYITDTCPTTYIYSANIYLGSSSGDIIHFRGNTVKAGSTEYTVINSSGYVYRAVFN